MKIKEQTRKLATGCSKHRFEVVDKTDEVSSKTVLRLWMELTKSAQNTVFEVADRTDESATVLRLWMELTKSAQNTVFEVADRTDESVTSIR
ncbi:hypothetical protein [Streptococcus pneumoniae]|uniref:hypothetical protein n=1 Tax=Streptococcus pneumoniae TaxID=1313 RepID=UPI0015DB51E3|nr:hypothetical protein [Streptococcus pneumoniae]